MEHTLEQRALLFVKELVAAYTGRCKSVLPAVLCSEDVVWIASEQEMPFRGAAAIHHMLEQASRRYRLSPSPRLLLEARTLPEDACIVYGAIHSTNDELALRVSFVLENTQEGLVLAHANTSHTCSPQNRQLLELKREREALRLSLERHQLIMNQTTDIIFEWDIPSDTLAFSSNWKKKFGYDAISTNISSLIPLSDNVFPEDIPAFIKIMQDTIAGKPYSKAEFRIRELSGRFLWCRIRATVQFDESHHALKAIGVIIDIDAEKRQKQALLDQVQRDALTGLYNKAAINSLVEQRMESGKSSSMQALMIIDVDNFKGVNDTYGHLCGDSVLSDVAAGLKSHTRSTDLVGRIGGDEFLVYLPHVTSEATAIAKAEELLTALRLIIPENGAPPLSCSIGVAGFPRGSVDYYALYKCADRALYHQKATGRGGATLYDPTICDGMPCGLAPSSVNEAIGSDENNAADEQMAQYVFRSLYAARNTGEAMNRLLEIIGRSYDVSRVYIFENSKDDLTVSNTFEWCASGVSPQMSALQNLSYQKDLGDFQINFNADGVFYCRDINSLSPALTAVLQPQGICSMLQCAILDEGEFRGLIGFDENRANCSWSDGVVASFKLVADVLSVFLLKLRMKQKLERYGG